MLRQRQKLVQILYTDVQVDCHRGALSLSLFKTRRELRGAKSNEPVQHFAESNCRRGNRTSGNVNRAWATLDSSRIAPQTRVLHSAIYGFCCAVPAEV